MINFLFALVVRAVVRTLFGTGPLGGAPLYDPEEITFTLGEMQFNDPISPVVQHNQPPSPPPTSDAADVEAFLRDNFGFVGDLFAPIVGTVISAIEWVWHMISDVAQWVIQEIGKALSVAVDLAWGVFHHLLDSLGWVFDQLWQNVFVPVINAVDWVLGKIADVASSVLGVIFDSLQTIFDALWSLIEPAVTFLWNNLIAPVLDQLGQVFDYVFGGGLIDDVLGLIGSAIDEALGVLDTIGDLVGSLVDLALAPFKFVLDLVTQAIDWITWFAEHTFSEIGDLINEGVTTGAHAIETMVLDSIESNGDDWERIIAGWIE